MASDFGKRVLGEVSEESLDELLHDLRSLRPLGAAAYNASNCHLGIQELDELLQVFMPSPPAPVSVFHPESPVSHGQDAGHGDDAGERNEVETESRSPADPISALRVDEINPVVEVSSFSSGAGKTQLFYYLTAVAILPAHYDGIQLGGRNAAIVFIDADGRFDADRLHAVAKGIIQRKLDANLRSETAESRVESLLLSALHHVHVFRPQSSLSLLATLQCLDAYLLDLNRHFSSSRPLHAILLDSASAFFWQDKLRDEVARIEEIGRSSAEIERGREQNRSFQLGVLYAALVEELRRLQRRFGCAIFYTCIAWGAKRTGPSESGTGLGSESDFGFYSLGAGIRFQGPSLRPPLPAPWGIFPHLRLIVQRDGARPFPPKTTIQTASRDAPTRYEVVAKGRFTASINGWGSEGWSSKVVEGLQRRKGFSFHVDRSGVGLSTEQVD